MSIHQLNMYGMDMVEVAIERLKAFEPPEGYYLAFSGGKDSCTIKALADMAGVKYDAHYRVTSVDPPELVQFVKTFPDVEFEFPLDDNGKVITMWNLIPRRTMPPTRTIRYCCAELKESGGENRFVVTGVRKDESVRRKMTRSGLELGKYKTTKRELLDPDNPTPEMMYHCKTYYRKVLNPIVDWTTDEVWEFIKEYKVRYCCLYDEGFTRLGCIGCPMATKAEREMEFKRYPKYKDNYIRAFQKMIDNHRGGTTAQQPKRGSIRGTTKKASERTKDRSRDDELVAVGDVNRRVESFDIESNGIDVMKWWLSK